MGAGTLPLIVQTHWIGWLFRITGILFCGAFDAAEHRLQGAVLLALWCSAATEPSEWRLPDQKGIWTRLSAVLLLLLGIGMPSRTLTVLRELCSGILMLRRHAGL